MGYYWRNPYQYLSSSGSPNYHKHEDPLQHHRAQGQGGMNSAQMEDAPGKKSIRPSFPETLRYVIVVLITCNSAKNSWSPSPR